MIDFNNLNEYQQRDENKASVLAEQLTEIVSHMDGWELIPRDRSTEEHIPRGRYLIEVATGLQILCESNQYDCQGKFKFRAIEWPTFVDDNGQERQRHPADLYQPREKVPATCATHGRPFKAVAKQIESRLIPEYRRIHARCKEMAVSAQKWSDKVQDCRSRLAEATGNDEAIAGRRGSTYYVQDLPGETVRVEYRSPGDCKINLSTDEMIEVVGFLRQLRAKAAA